MYQFSIPHLGITYNVTKEGLYSLLQNAQLEQLDTPLDHPDYKVVGDEIMAYWQVLYNTMFVC